MKTREQAQWLEQVGVEYTFDNYEGATSPIKYWWTYKRRNYVESGIENVYGVTLQQARKLIDEWNRVAKLQGSHWLYALATEN